jgi:ribonuclease J
MICEGTRVNSTQVDSEEHVKEVAQERVEKTDGLVVANFPVRDTDRMERFFQVAQQTDRALVINLKQAYLLELFRASGIATPRIDVTNAASVWANCSFNSSANVRRYDPSSRSALARQ